MSGASSRNQNGRERRLARFLLEEVSEGVLTLLHDGLITYGNARFAQTVKTPAEELAGSRFQRFLNPVEASRFEDWLRLEESGKREFTLVASDGSPIPAEVLIRPLGEKNRNELAVLVRDVSRRRINQEVLANVIGNAPNLAVSAWDSTGTFTMAAGRAFEAIGVDPQTLVGQSIYLSRTNTAAIVEHRRRVMGGEFVRVREEIRGHLLDMWYAPLKDAQGVVIGGVSAAADITELIQAQRELQQRVQREAAIAEFGQRALRGAPHDALIREATALASATLGVEGAGMGELQPDGMVVLKGVIGLKGEQRAPVPAEAYPQINHTLRSQRPTIVEDYAADPVFNNLDMVAEYGVASGLVVPVTGKDGPYGTLGVHSMSPRKFSAYDINFVQAIGNILAQAIDREHADEELRRSGEYYRSLIQNVSDIVGVVGTDGTLLFVSDSVWHTLGRRPEHAIGANVFMFHHPADVDRVRESFAAAFKNPDQPVVMESRVRHEDGRWIDFELTFKTTTGVAGQPVLISVMRDISERKRLEQEHRLLASIVETSDDAIASSNRDGFITSWNKGAERLFGYRASEVLGKRRAEFDNNYSGEISANFRTLMLTSQPLRYETKRTRRDGSIVEVSVTLSPLRDANGEVTGLTMITRDITERRLAERAGELARSNVELQQFAYVASHDLKEPLHVISGFANLLRQRLTRDSDSEALEFLGYMEDGAQRMRELVDALLDYATVNPKFEGLKPVDCAKVLDTVIHDLDGMVKDTNARVVCARLPTVTGDERLLAQVFQNLISNALKFRGARPPLIEIDAQRQNTEWLFRVRDNGIGVEPRDADRIFNMFERVHHRGEYPGRGIGLAICKRAIERLGGRIWLDSKPGQGTSFYFTIPAFDAARAAQP